MTFIPRNTSRAPTEEDVAGRLAGVHSPEFPIEREVHNVESAVREHALTYPVGMGNEFVARSAYGNQYWPTMYLIDRAGQIRYTQIGEGS